MACLAARRLRRHTVTGWRGCHASPSAPCRVVAARLALQRTPRTAAGSRVLSKLNSTTMAQHAYMMMLSACCELGLVDQIFFCVLDLSRSARSVLVAPPPCEACAAGQGLPAPPCVAFRARRGIANRSWRVPAVPPWGEACRCRSGPRRAAHAPGQACRCHRVTQGAPALTLLWCAAAGAQFVLSFSSNWSAPLLA